MARMPKITDLLHGRASATRDLRVHLSDRDGGDLHHKLRQAYWWIMNNAVISPYYDIEFGERSRIRNAAGDELVLHDAMSYSSYVLLPMLTLVTCRRALMIGGPGRGKTTSAILMALIAGATQDEVRRSIQRGHPQLTIADLLGSPLPSDMIRADDLSNVRISWRKWIGQRVKIIDEYNRIPTKTQSALLSLMAEGYAEMFDQYVHTGRSSWFLTANDDIGGGTFQVIEALKDRIDIVVRAVPFHSGFIKTLLSRVESSVGPEDLVPAEIVFKLEELDAIYTAILDTSVPDDVLSVLAFFLGQLDFCRLASPRFELMSKDTLRLSGRTVGAVCDERCPLDKRVHLCTQTETGVSARAYQTILHYAKALAWFRGQTSVTLDDIRQIVPWVLHEKLQPNARSPFFEPPSHRLLLQDRVSWIRNLLDMAIDQWSRYERTRRRVMTLHDELDKGLAGVDLKTTRARMDAIVSAIHDLMTKSELSGAVYEDLIHLKALYSRYQNYARWLQDGGAP